MSALTSQAIFLLLGAFLLKSVIAVALWADKLASVSYEAALRVRSLEGRPLTPGEDFLERAAMRTSSRFAMSIPVIGCFWVMAWPNVALPRRGKFDGAEAYRQQVRQICFRAFLPDAMIILAALLYLAYLSLAK
jgi:hypothetical protein